MAGRRTYRIAVVQLPVMAEDPRANLRTILEALDLAERRKADFLVTPEMALTGYHGNFDKHLRDELVSELRRACRRAGVTLIAGVGDKRGGRTYNEQLIIGGDGRIIGRHAKIVATIGDRKWSTPGQKLRVFRDRGLTFGCLICNDLWVTPGCGPGPDPRLTLQLSRRGARVIFHSVYSDPGRQYIAYHESNLSLRAREGGLFIATANALQPRVGVNSATGIVGPDGEWIVRSRRRGRQMAFADVKISHG